MKLRERISINEAKEADGSFWDDYYCSPAISQWQTLAIMDLLIRLKPRKCFEWGSGWSSVYFPRFIPESKWISMEHSQEWFDIISPHLPPNVKVMVRPIWGKYVSDAVDEVKGQPFDFVFIDGERRDDCVEMALHMLRKGGIAVQHDAPPLKRLRERFEENGISEGLWWGRK